MSDKFNIEIITPDKTLIKSEASQVTIPAFEGSMTILKDHISLVTFLRPGFIEIESDKNSEKFYIEEGTVEFFKNTLLILSSMVKNIKEISQDYIENILENSRKEINNNEIRDKDKYILSYKINTLKEIKK
tara:strand:- start:158 stop:550 length:393 start_codon:yes stop_codon:yes gene_type:complete